MRIDITTDARFIKRFWAKVEITKTCWLWKGCVDDRGHGQTSVMRKGKQSRFTAHKVSYILSGKTVPNGMFLLHRCKNFNCVNPRHLYLNRRSGYDTVTVKERLEKRTDKTPGHGPKGDCWIWTGTRDEHGYGRLSVRAIRISPVKVSRLSYEVAFGPIPEGLCVLHRCDYPPCLRPEHLRLGTKKENSEDMVHKGRAATGERHGMRLHPERHWSRNGKAHKTKS